MKKAAVLLALAGLTGCSLFGGKAPAPMAPMRFQPAAESQPLLGTVAAGLTLLNTNAQARPNESLVFSFRLVNVTPADAVVYNELALGWLVTIEFLNAEGRVIRSRPVDMKRGRGGKYHYVNLPPGGFVGRQYTILPGSPEWDLKPGKYLARAIYRNPYEPCVASPCFTDEDVKTLGEKALVPMLTGLVASKAVESEILAK